MVATPASAAKDVSSGNSGVQVWLLNEHGERLPETRLAISRALPGDLAAATNHPRESMDAQSSQVVLCSGSSALPRLVSLTTFRKNGDKLDEIPAQVVKRRVTSSGKDSPSGCVETPLIRVTSDALEAHAPGLRGRSIEGELGGSLEVSAGSRVLATLPIGGPREPDFALAPFRATLRVRIVRSVPGGPPPMGENDADAQSIMKREVRIANQRWSQCGFSFDDESQLDVAVVDPPSPYLVAVGCDYGLPASGGHISLSIDGQPLRVPTRPKDAPRSVALRLAKAAEDLGFLAEIERNPQTLAAALPTFDVTFRARRGTLARLGTLGNQPVSTDLTLGVCVGDVDLEDGLDHFTNVDSMAGTLEERSLLRAIVDRDLCTIDVVVVESFSRLGRIGESFVPSEGGNLGNLVILNREGLRAAGRSFALAHELGHILLDDAGHPDDYGVDTPWSLMDSDAVDGTIFGPRHLTLEDCLRALRQSGPAAPTVLLRSSSRDPAASSSSGRGPIAVSAQFSH